MGMTRIKYILEFTSILDDVYYKLTFTDKSNEYDDAIYPKYLLGSATPIVKSYNNSDSNPYTTIVASQLEITILTTSDFVPDDFKLATNRQWKIDLYRNYNINFQGWLKSSELVDLYDNTVTSAFRMIAIDGLADLKNITFQKVNHVVTDLIDDYFPDPLPFYGLYEYTQYLYWCLNRLDYDIGFTTIFSSLRYKEVPTSDIIDYDTQLDWKRVKLWSDQFFDDDGTPKKCYEVLETILRSFGLKIFQDQGSFCIVHINDFYYIENQSVQTLVSDSSVQFDRDFNNYFPGNVPLVYNIGFDKENKPINPPQNITNDEAYASITAKIDYNLQALLFQNPSFEIGAVNGGLPPEFAFKEGGLPNSGLTNSDSYIGDWSLKVFGNGQVQGSTKVNRGFIDNKEGWIIAENNKKVSISFNWKVPKSNLEYSSGNEIGIVPSFSIIFIRDGDNKAFFLQQSPYRANAYPNGAPYNQSEDVFWQAYRTGQPGEQDYDEWELNTIKPSPTDDYFGWQSFQIDSPALPGKGKVYVRIYGAKGIPYNGFDANLPMVNANTNNFIALDYNALIYYLMDNLQISQGDSETAYNKRVGETHLTTNKTLYGNSQPETLPLTLVSYPYNKRLAQNVLYGEFYADSIVSDTMWLFKLSNQALVKGYMLPEAVIYQYTKAYRKPSMIWSGNLYTDEFSMFRLIKLRYFEAMQFIVLSASHDLRNSVLDIKIREIDDSVFNFTYKFTYKFEKSARKVSN